MRTMSSPKGVQKQSHGCSCQGCKTTNHALRNPPKPSGSCIRNLHQHTPEPSGSGTCLRNLHQHTPEPSGTCLRNLHQHAPEPSGTFRNLSPEPTPAHTGTLRNLPEPASGTCCCDLHRHTPELIWAEDPLSSRCWGTKGFLLWSAQHKFRIVERKPMEVTAIVRTKNMQVFNCNQEDQALSIHHPNKPLQHTIFFIRTPTAQNQTKNTTRKTIHTCNKPASLVKTKRRLA